MSGPPTVFVLVPKTREFDPVVGAIYDAAGQAGVRVLDPEPDFSALGPDWIDRSVARADVVVVDVTRSSPETSYALGICRATGTASVVLVHASAAVADRSIPRDLWGGQVLEYRRARSGVDVLIDRLANVFRSLRDSPAERGLSEDALNALTREAFANLVFELLTQMGFESLRWVFSERSDSVLMAQWPKKDPGDIRTVENWVVILGSVNALGRELDRIANGELSSLLDEQSRSQSGVDVRPTVLLIPYRAKQSGLMRLAQRLERVDRLASAGVRTVLWSPADVQRLISGFPQLIAKYSTSEVQSAHERKQLEELYRENVRLVARLERTAIDLENERGLREAAERDAIWRDVAFAAAHKLGNPVFAAETRLASLRETTGSNPSLEGALAELERAKGILTEFKSVAKAEQLILVPTDIVPLIKRSGEIAARNGVQVDYRLPASLIVRADSAKLRDSFDELVANAMKWMPESEPRLRIEASFPTLVGEFEQAESDAISVEIDFSDNGCGVDPDETTRVFQAFVSNDPHGTGLGLAVVKRIIEGHGGTVTEVGGGGAGAVFRIQLPIAEVTT